ncbi:MAG: DEAD/DEAH box helicase [Rhodospirillales bacterium]|nr:DEAD/DEAH box helicase [Rhodospirillales bacterium]
MAENFEVYGKYHKLSKALLIGGVSYTDQEKLLDRGVDVLIATPGRLLDHFERGRILLNDVKVLVIDEADRMLDMGFIPDVEKIVKLLPPLRQTLFFSATMPPEIRRLADAFLSNPKEITVAPPASPAATVAQGLTVIDPMAKREALRRLIHTEQVKNALIFCNRKRDVDTLYKSLKKHGFNAGALHGDMDQGTRTATLDAFKRNEITLLVCSDVAARGLDIDDLSHVFNFDVPIHAEDYVHRIGRTGRAGRSGRAFTFATPEDGKFVAAIEKLISKAIPRIEIEGLSGLALDAGQGEGDSRGRRRGAGRGRSQGKPSRSAPARPTANAAAREEPRSDRPRQPEPQPHVESARSAPALVPAHPVAAVTAREEPRSDRPRQPEPQRVGPTRPAPARQEQRGSRRGGRNDDDDGPTPVGLGDHVPAFLMRGRRVVG